MTASSPGTGRRPEHREGFWTLVVGLPAALSVLRLWVESGGELQTTLLLVSNVSPLSLGAALFATTTQLATIILVALFTVGGVLGAAVASAPRASRLRQRPPLVALAAAAFPDWFVVVTFALAVFTWEILYLPLLVPAAVATYQRPPWRLHDRWPVAVVGCLVALAGYGWLVGPAVAGAWAGREWPVVLLLVLPPLVAFGITGPLPGWFAGAFATVAQLAIVGLVVLAVWTAVNTPILPLVATQVDTATEPELLRGHVISVDDLYLVLLQERGGVRYLPIGKIHSTVLCGTPQELPVFKTRVRDYHVEDSLLSAIGRHVRPHAPIDPLCRVTSASGTAQITL